MAGHHIAQGMAVNQLPAAELRHPLSLVALAYGLGEAKPMSISRDKLLSLEAYAKVRVSSRPAFIAHRKLRSVQLGEHLNLQFEDEQTVLRPDPGDAAHREDLRRGGHRRARSRPTRRWCPTAATGRRRC